MTNYINDPENKNLPNTDDYLWDGSGTPDPEIQRLESLLVEFRHQERPLVLPAGLPGATAVKPRGLLLHFPSVQRFAAAAVIFLALGVGLFYSLRPVVSPPNTAPGWDVSELQGAPQIGSQTISGASAATKLRVGQTLTTDSTSSASLSDFDLGEIRIDPNSRVRLLQTDSTHKHIQLEVGTIHAAIWAPAGQFVVDTPSAVAVDLGCAYTLQVSPDGSGTIRTTLGWVGFHLNGRDSFIPAGAICSTRPKIGPGTPCFEDAPDSFRAALSEFDLAAPDSDAAKNALNHVLSNARSRDGLTLWHLLSRTTGSDRARVFDRFAALVPPPPGVTREGILALNSHMLDLYWNALDLGDIFIWRFWEQSTNPHPDAASQPLLPQKNLLLKKAPTS